MEIVQSVTSNKNDIPKHFIPISSFGCHRGNTDKKASHEYKVLYRAWCDVQIGGIKFMSSPHDKRGQIFVDPADAERIIRPTPSNEPPARKSPSSTQIDALTAGISALATNQETLIAAVERIAFSLEQIARQPLARMDDVGICDVATSHGTNGYHCES
jgi:hypothetical protein